MILSTRTARIFFAVALLAWGVQHFLYTDFIAGRPPAWPEYWPGKTFLSYVAGLLLVFTAIAIVLNFKAMLLSACTGIVILLWAGVRNVYLLLSTLDYGFLLTNTNKALTISFGSLLIASTFQKAHKGQKGQQGQEAQQSQERFFPERVVMILAPMAKFVIGFFLFANGVQHFLFADFVKFLVPTWIPGALPWTYIAGVALSVCGLSIIIGIRRALAATLAGWMILAWVFLLHIPRAVTATTTANISNEWTAVFEALAVSGLLFVIAQEAEVRTKLAENLKPNSFVMNVDK